MIESQKSLSLVKQIEQTTVFRSLGSKYNQEIYYFPSYLRIKLRYVSSMEPQTRYATADIAMYLSVYYGSVQQPIIDELGKKVFIESEFNDIIELNLDVGDDRTEKRQPVYLVEDKENQLLHWKIIIREFRFKIKPHIFFHPFQTLDLISQIKIAPVQLVLTPDRTIVAVFNLMDNEKPNKKLIEGQKNYQVCGFYLSPNKMSLSVQNHPQEIQQFLDKIKQEKQEIDQEKTQLKTLRFIQEPQRELRHVMDYFSTAKIIVHLHSNGKAAFSNFSSNFLCFVMLAILSIFVHFQELKADQIIASLATIAIAFGTSIISIRSQIAFKPGQTFFQIVYCTQMVILVVPLFNYWQTVRPSAVTTSVTTTSLAQVSATSYNDTVISYLDQILQEVKGKPLVENIWANSSFQASMIITLFLCLLIILLCLYNVYTFFSFRKRPRTQKVKADEEFMKFDRKYWKNVQCREFFRNPLFDFLVELDPPKKVPSKRSWIKRDS